MIDLHYWPTPNGFKITIMLEECGLPYKIVPVNIGTGEQFKPEFLKISPNNRMPAIVDHDPPGGGAPVSVFESGAILQYLAEKSGKFLPKDLRGKYEVLQWVNWQMGGLGPMAGQANHFNMYAPQFNPTEALKYGQERYSNEVNRLFTHCRVSYLPRRSFGRNLPAFSARYCRMAPDSNTDTGAPPPGGS